MVIIEIAVLGLIAIISDGELQCTVPGSVFEVEPFELVMLDPGVGMPHEPRLWVQASAVVEPRLCWKPDRSEEAADCEADLEKKWVLVDLRKKNLTIPQSTSTGSFIDQSKRKCWSGAEPSDDSCWVESAQCGSDVSWLPEYARASGLGTIDADVLRLGSRETRVGAFVVGVRGTLEAGPIGDHVWSWDWNSTCSTPRDVPKYKQKFATRALIKNVQLSRSQLIAVDRFGESIETVELKPITENAGKPWTVELINLPPAPVPLKKVGNKCFLPHYKAYQALVGELGGCYREPWVAASGGICPAPSGMTDPFCPPTGFGRRK